ncbi:hypothetical protein XFF4834R_chr13790 [Xanthomonas citri pv. fuscans]|nr:hypothetical protein XFF4834R_chr13790 [Xanthomonas citri pv. fuscans]
MGSVPIARSISGTSSGRASRSAAHFRLHATGDQVTGCAAIAHHSELQRISASTSIIARSVLAAPRAVHDASCSASSAMGMLKKSAPAPVRSLLRLNILQ